MHNVTPACADRPHHDVTPPGFPSLQTLLLAFGLALAAAAGLSSPVLAADANGVHVARDGKLLRGNKPIRAIGVNYYDCFVRTLEAPSTNSTQNTSYEAGFAILERYRIPFARISVTGFWPSEMALYKSDPNAYLRRLDGVMRSAEKHGIGIVPSLFWNLSTVPDIVGEPCNQWGNTNSQTHAFMRKYIRDIVGRYKDSPAIWGWEFGNEFNLAKDLPNASTQHPPVVPSLGTPATRSTADELTHDMVSIALAEFAREVRKLDPARFITSGNAIPRPSAWHMRKELSWTKDSPEEFNEILVAEHPAPIDVLSVHTYAEDIARIVPCAEAARKAHKPLFVGEFGVPGARTPEHERQFQDLLDTLRRERVPLSALWVFDFAWQGKDYSVTPDNERGWQLEAIQKANEALQAE